MAAGYSSGSLRTPNDLNHERELIVRTMHSIEKVHHDYCIVTDVESSGVFFMDCNESNSSLS